MYFNNSNNFYHIVGFGLITFYYIFSLIFFKEIIIPIHDNLDIGVVYDHIISEVYKGKSDAVSIFLSGTLDWYFLDEIFYPLNLLHLIFSNENFYYFEDIFKKIISYLSFFILGKSFSKNKIVLIISSVIYATSTQMFAATSGLGLAMMPYFLYLLTKRESLKIKHYLIIFFMGLNTSLVHDFLSLLFLIPLSLIIKKNFSIKKYINCFAVLFTAVIIVSIPLFLVVFLEETHRISQSNPPLSNYFFSEIKNLFFLDQNFSERSFFIIPYKILCFVLVLFYFFTKSNMYKNIIKYLIVVFFLKIFAGSNVVSNLIDYSFESLSFLKGFDFSRISKIFPLIFALLLILYYENSFKDFLKRSTITLALFSIFLIQIQEPQIEMIKVFAENNIKSDKNIELKSNLDNKKFSNFLSIITSKNNYHSEITFDLKSNRTFKGYYRFEDYKKLKKIVGEEKIMSIGLDPMVAAMNNIKVIDGYHTLYNLKYKLKFRKIIENELNKDEVLKDYYDNWGNRVYVFYNDKNNLDINFQEAKNIGAKYVLSSFKIQKKELSLKCGPCFDSKDLNLYEIL